LQAGEKAGVPRAGESAELPRLPVNPELAAASAFRLRHSKGGTVSLAVGSGADGEPPPPGPPYAFRITFGPGPVPTLDGNNPVIGRVLAGGDVLAAIAQVPTFTPPNGGPLGNWNKLAGLIGDGRAATARDAWSKPRQAVVITAAGVLPAAVSE